VSASHPSRKIWIDLDNTPHVPFFEPIIEELKRRGFNVVLTARNAFQVCELADSRHLSYTRVGAHHGRNRLLKAVGLLWRAMQLAPFVLREKPQLALSHGARAQMIISGLMRVPTVLIDDYEFSSYPPGMRPDWQVVPSVIPDETLCCNRNRIRKYPGIKEDVYVGRLTPDAKVLADLGISKTDLVVTVRPPATEAHYHNTESEKLFARLMHRVCTQPGTRAVLLPRNQRQAAELRSQSPEWFRDGRTLIPPRALDALNLIWHSDLVVSAGGTMNREAAALGVPVYSLFRGEIGAVDHELARQGRLVMIENAEEVDRKVRLERRHRNGHSNGVQRRALEVIADHITEIVHRTE
jgi:uncharacterized protein